MINSRIMEKSIAISSGVDPNNLGPLEMYTVTEPIRGLAVIINNFNFKELEKNLTGGESDTLRLIETFEGLKFKVNVHVNIKAQEMRNIMRRYGEEDHTHFGCFICIISSHGSYESLCGADLESLQIGELMECISECATLTGKPKMFFIDACRGIDEKTKVKPTEGLKDFVVYHATLPGKKAYMIDSRKKWNGSVFIKSLCDVLRQYGEQMPMHFLDERLKIAVKNSSERQTLYTWNTTSKIISFVPNRIVCQRCTYCNPPSECTNCMNKKEPEKIVDAEKVIIEDPQINPEDCIRVVLIGKTGSGKSCTGNTILGKDKFEYDLSGTSVTETCDVGVSLRFNRYLMVIDSSGLFDTTFSESEIKKEIEKTTSRGVDAFLLCIRIGRFTKEDIASLRKYETYFGTDFSKYVVVVFTHFDQWQLTRIRNNKPHLFEDFIESLSTEQQKMLSDLGNNIVTFANFADGVVSDDQVKRLITKLEKMRAVQMPAIQFNRPGERTAPSNEIRMVLLGNTANGKSRTGNSILGNPTGFGCRSDARSVTSECLWGSVERFGRKLDVVDTPGVFGATRSNIDIQKEIKRCITIATPGPHAFLLCVKMARLTTQDADALGHFLRYFGPELLQYAIVIFTCVDQWEEDIEEQGDAALNLEEYIRNLPDYLKQFLKSIQNRYLFFNNRLKGADQEKQIKSLVDRIEKMMVENNNSCYTNEIYENVTRRNGRKLD